MLSFGCRKDSVRRKSQQETLYFWIKQLFLPHLKDDYSINGIRESFSEEILSMETLDDIDLQLLRILQSNSNLTTKELAAQVNLSSTPVYERVKLLEKKGYIKRYAAILNHELLNNGFCVFCNIRLKKHSREYIIHFTEAIMKIDEITECYNISGDYDFMLKIMVRNMAHYQDFVQNKLGVIESVGSLHSSFVLKEVKQTYEIPLNS